MVAQEKSRCCGSLGAFLLSVVRCFEHLPLIGHGIAAVHACCGDRARAERAAIKATVGIIFGIFNFIAEAMDEMARHRSDRTHYISLAGRCKWMSAVRDRKLEDLCLPASHQSATYKMYKKVTAVPLVTGWSFCQRLDITEQLMGGIRLFDLRVTQDDDHVVWLHHNIIWCVQLVQVLQEVKAFVSSYPTEVVCLHFSNDGKPINWGRVDEDIQEYIGREKLVSSVHSDYTIGEMTSAGENVIVFNVPTAAYSWPALDYRWVNTARPSELFVDLENYIQEFNENRPRELFWYKAECTPDCALITRDFGGIPGMWVAPKTDEKVEFLDGLSGIVNHGVSLILEAESRIPFHFLSVDFVHDGIIQRIIDCNLSNVNANRNTSINSNNPTYTTSVQVSPAGQAIEMEEVALVGTRNSSIPHHYITTSPSHAPPVAMTTSSHPASPASGPPPPSAAAISPQHCAPLGTGEHSVPMHYMEDVALVDAADHRSIGNGGVDNLSGGARGGVGLSRSVGGETDDDTDEDILYSVDDVELGLDQAKLALRDSVLDPAKQQPQDKSALLNISV